MKLVRDLKDVETVEKVWGMEKVFINNDLYCGKMLLYRPGWASSLHFHMEKHETLAVMQGKIVLELWEDGLTGEPKFYELDSRNGGYVILPPGTPHRISALVPALVVEWSTPHKDEDVVRIEASKEIAKVTELKPMTNTIQ